MNTRPTRSWRGFVLLALLGFLFFYNFSIAQKERFLRQEDSLILALAPVDPRSLMQGDYMTLNFDIESQILAALRAGEREAPRKGRVVVAPLEDEHVFKRLDDGEKPGPDERFLQYSIEGSRLKIGGGDFFFEEGLAPLYNLARYARVSADEEGRAIVTGLLDADKRPLNKQRWDAEKQRLRAISQ